MAVAWLPVTMPNGFAPIGAFQENGLKFCAGIFVAGPGDGDVSGHDLFALFLELPGDDRFERFRFDPEQLKRGAERGVC